GRHRARTGRLCPGPCRERGCGPVGLGCRQAQAQDDRQGSATGYVWFLQPSAREGRGNVPAATRLIRPAAAMQIVCRCDADPRSAWHEGQDNRCHSVHTREHVLLWLYAEERDRDVAAHDAVVLGHVLVTHHHIHVLQLCIGEAVGGERVPDR